MVQGLRSIGFRTEGLGLKAQDLRLLGFGTLNPKLSSLTWTPKVGKIIAQHHLKTAPKAIILHTFGVQVRLMQTQQVERFFAFRKYYGELGTLVKIILLAVP